MKVDMRLPTPADLSEAAIEDAIAILKGVGVEPKWLLICSEMTFDASAAALAAHSELELIELPPAMLKHRDSWALCGTNAVVWSEGA